MEYELELTFPIGEWGNDTFANADKVRKALVRIKDITKRLEYFNKHVRSLASYAMAGQIYFEWGHDDKQRIKVYCGCKQCRATADFDPEHEKIFRALRDKEVTRIIKGIERCSTYADKLNFLMGVNGFHLHFLTVFPNIPYDGSRDDSHDMLSASPVIDLTPKTKDEIRAYNLFQKKAFIAKYKPNGSFSEAYNGFNYLKEKERLNTILLRHVDPELLVGQLVLKIEAAFDYRQVIDSRLERVNNQPLHKRLMREGTPAEYFLQLVEGIITEIDLTARQLTVLDFKTWEHAEQAYQFYTYLRDLQRNGLERLNQERIARRRDFNNWLMGKPAWRDIAWEYNTGNGFQHKQDLVAVFWNAYVYFEEKVTGYVGEFGELPETVLQQLIFQFRQSFPIDGRIEGVNYFDDLIEQLIAHKQAELTSIHTSPEPAQHYHLSAQKGTKINLIRVLNALYEAQFFTNDAGQIPAKEEFMRSMGAVFGQDFSSYHADLSQAFAGGLETNLQIFDRLKTITENAIVDKEAKQTARKKRQPNIR